MKKYGLRRIACVTLAAAAMFTGCAGASRSYSGNTTAGSAPARDAVAVADLDYGGEVWEGDWDDAAEMAIPAESMANPASGGGGSYDGIDTTERKIVMTYDVTLQTVTFDQCVQDIADLAQRYEGLIEYSRVEGEDMYEQGGRRSANFTLRVAPDKADAVIAELGAQYNLTDRSAYQEDISNSYYDTAARLRSLRTQEERLLEMMEQAETLDQLLAIESQLQQVIYEIEYLTENLNRMDRQVNLSTMHIYVYEVVQYEELRTQPVNMGGRLQNAWHNSWVGFVAFCQGVLVFLVLALPFLLVLAVLAVIVILLVRRRKRRCAAAGRKPEDAFQDTEKNDGSAAE